MMLIHRLRQVADLSWQQRGDLLRAVWELALASRRLRHQPASGISGSAMSEQEASEDTLVGRIAWAIPRAAAVVPWRADCLRQAEAARHWLDRRGMASEVRLGVRKTEAGGIEAHAWLLCGRKIVTGGDPKLFEEFR
jgi:hypothetical protein